MTELTTKGMTDFRIIGCEYCGTEGKLYCGDYEDGYCLGDCPVCEGTGGEIIETQPIGMEDLDMLEKKCERCVPDEAGRTEPIETEAA